MPSASGTLTTTGQWTLGQAFGHLATWIGYAYEGTPLRMPWILRVVIRMRKQAFLNKPMPAGVRIPGTKDGTLGTVLLDLDAGLSRLLPMIDRLQSERPVAPHAIFGRLTHDDWIKMHLRHGELHLSHFDVEVSRITSS
ncbi:MAG: DUF1569 domain-containing protein [Tepidisphaeraceae bacterium]